MREPGGHNVVAPEWSVTVALTRPAEDIGLKFSTVKSARWTSSRWPADRRRKSVSYTVHRILAYIEDEQEWFAAILAPSEGKCPVSRNVLAISRDLVGFAAGLK